MLSVILLFVGSAASSFLTGLGRCFFPQNKVHPDDSFKGVCPSQGNITWNATEFYEEYESSARTHSIPPQSETSIIFNSSHSFTDSDSSEVPVPPDGYFNKSRWRAIKHRVSKIDMNSSLDSTQSDGDSDFSESSVGTMQYVTCFEPCTQHSILVLIRSQNIMTCKSLDVVTSLCCSLRTILKRMISDIVTMQTHLADDRAFKLSKIKKKLPKHRKALKSFSKQILKVPYFLDPDGASYLLMSRVEIIKILFTQQYLVSQILQTSIDIGVYKIKFTFAHRMYDSLIVQILPEDSSVDMLPIQNAHASPQSIIDYIHASTLNAENDHQAESSTLNLDLFSGVSVNFGLQIYGILIFEHLAKVTNELNLSHYHSFLRHEIGVHDNETMISMAIGIAISSVSEIMGQAIHKSKNMNLVSMFMSFIDGDCYLVRNENVYLCRHSAF